MDVGMSEPRTTTELRTPVLSSIWGQSNVTRAVSSGIFVCPTEGMERAYWHFRTRSWRTVLSLPVIPGDIVEEYVECFCCGETVHPQVVKSPHPSLRVESTTD